MEWIHPEEGHRWKEGDVIVAEFCESGGEMTPKPCSICGSIEYTSCYVSKDGRRVCDLHGTHTAFESLCKAVGIKPGELGVPKKKDD